MAPLIVLVLSLFGLRALGTFVPLLADWLADGRYALALMLLLTASTHFIPSTRLELVRMVPERLPLRPQLVTLTGVLELLAAAGLVVPASAPMAGAGLIVLLVALFPATVKAALERLPLRGKSVTPLVLRLPLQALYIAVAFWASQPTQLFGL